MTKTALDWPALMAFGLGHLRLPPDQFWAMPPRELSACGQGAFGFQTIPLGRTDFDILATRYPDDPHD